MCSAWARRPTQSSHEAQARGGDAPVAAGLREFTSATAGGFLWSDDIGPDQIAADHILADQASFVDWFADGGRLGELDLFDLNRLKLQAVELWFAER